MKWFLFVVLFGSTFAFNPEENENIDDPDLFEGDMRLTPEQRQAAMNGGDVDAVDARGSVIGRQWPGALMPYEIDDYLANNQRAMQMINAGMREWTSQTCIRFKKRTTEKDYVFFKFNPGCRSYVGRRGGRQDITLSTGCWRVGTVAHEIGHALGFYHEQSRPDRDNYVTILWDNIKEKNKHNFNKYTRSRIDSLGTPYDYSSVMHYRKTSFSKNGQPTIEVKQSGVSIGQRNGISSMDAKQMNLLYKCSGGVGGGVTSPPVNTPPPPQTPPPPGGCKDDHAACPGWISLCKSHSTIKALCKRTCKAC